MTSQEFIKVDDEWKEVWQPCDLCESNESCPYIIKTRDGESHKVCLDCVWKALVHSSEQKAIENE